MQDMSDEAPDGTGVVKLHRAKRAVRNLLLAVGENPEREGLKETPGRVARSFAEMLAGYRQDPAKILACDFGSERYDEMVVLRAIPFHSLCEHHLLNFSGTATVAYLPMERVVGISKLARLVECYARRLQIQERMTVQIADALAEHLKPRGWGVRIEAQHLCMRARGVRIEPGPLVTTAVGGLIKEDEKARAEFLGERK